MRQRFFSKKESDIETIRLRIPAGIMYPEQLETLKKVAARYGKERIHLTVRKAVEIPGVPLKKVKQATEELAAAGWHTTSIDDNIRNVVACPGLYCSNSRVDTHSLGLEIDTNIISEEDLPAKLKISIAGCPNACSHPQINDIGIIGVSKVKLVSDKCEKCYKCIKQCPEKAIIKLNDGQVRIDGDLCIDCGWCADSCKALELESTCYRILVGGKLGRHPKFADFLVDVPNMQEVLNRVEQIVLLYREHGLPDERLGNMIERVTLEKFIKLIL